MARSLIGVLRAVAVGARYRRLAYDPSDTAVAADRWLALRSQYSVGLPALLLALACSGAKAPRPSGIDSAGLADEAPRFAAAGFVRLDSTKAFRSIKRVDTSWVDTVRSFSTVRDTIRVPNGLPFGPFDLFARSWTQPSMAGFTGAVAYVSPDGLLLRLQGLRANKVKAFLQLTGDSHCTYMTTGCDQTNRPLPGGTFSFTKWKAALQRYAPFKAAIDSAVQRGDVLGYDMLDEPPHPSWGGNLTKPLLDSMATYSKTLFPTLPAGATVDWHWRPQETYRVLDFMLAQTWLSKGLPSAWRDSAVATAKQNGVALAVSLNLYGGPIVAGCVLYQGACTLTAEERRAWLLALLGAPACALVMWKANPAVDTLAENRRVLRDIAQVAQLRSAPPCRRPT